MLRGWPLLLVLSLGCQDLPIEKPCGALPDRNACPSENGGTCDDRSCSALYTCLDGQWTFYKGCDQNTGGFSGTGGSAGQGGSAGSTCTGSAIDPGSCPSLQSPDCNLALAESCPVEACQLGCEGFLRCTNGEWSDSYVAYCTEDGELITP